MPCIDPPLKRAATLAAAVLTACASPNVPRSSDGSPVPSAGLRAPAPVRSMGEVRLQAAHRLVASNPGGTYLGPVPDMLLAIPVLEVELHGDGSIRRINVLRRPGQAPETLQMAIDAMRRAAPFGDVSRLPRPWKFSETFLFNDERKFKPRTLDN